jgi:hypothetical protein
MVVGRVTLILTQACNETRRSAVCTNGMEHERVLETYRRDVRRWAAIYALAAVGSLGVLAGMWLQLTH